MDLAARRKNEMLGALESCRALDDLDDPQFADLASALAKDVELQARFDGIQRADVTIKVVFADVPVPTDLMRRISRRLAENASPALPCPDLAARHAKRFSRRRWIAIVSTIAASLAILATFWLHLHQSSSISQQSAVNGAMAWFSQDNGPPGELLSIKPPPADYPISPDIVLLPNARWRRIADFLGGEAVAYDLPSGGGKATLYVAHRTVDGLPAYPPVRPALSTGGNSAAAWQSGGILYVLVVQGDTRTYASYLASGPLT